MFWFFSILWAVVYSVAWVLEYSGVIKSSPISTLVFFVGLVIVYGLSGINIINQWERRPVLLWGKYAKTAGPGVDWIEPIAHTILSDVSVQDRVEDLKVDNVQTHDNVRLNIVGVLTTRISPENVQKFIVEVDDAHTATTKRAVSAMTEVVGLNTLDYILDKKVEFSEKVRVALHGKVSGWGIEVKAVEIKDFKIADPEIEKSIAMKARATKEAEAELRRAEMQKQIAEKLTEAAGALDEPAWRLKSLETLIELCRSANNNTIIIPANLIEFANVLTGNPLKDTKGEKSSS